MIKAGIKLSLIFLITFLCFFYLPNTVEAQTPFLCSQSNGNWTTNGPGGQTGCLLPNGNFIPASPALAGAGGGGTPAKEDNSCSGVTPDILCRVVTSILHIPLIFSSWLLGLSGVLLNAVLKYTIIELSQNIRGISGINVAWSVVRDIANMAFIFILIYIAIKTILGLGSGELKKVLVRVVIAALLINFSLFFTKVIIDASNLVALTFYERLAPGAGSGSILGSGLSNSFMQPLGLNSFFDVGGSTGALAKYGLDIPKTFVISVGGSIFLVITAFVFLASSLMFLIRYVNIIFLLILSPIAFLGAVLPGFGEKIRGWWTSTLSAQAVFAPVFMILTWLVLTVIRDPSFFGTNASATPTGSSNNAAQALGTSLANIAEVQNDVGVFGLIMNFVIIIVFTIGILIISKKVADQGGSIGAKVVGGALGATALGGRLGGGWASKKLADSKTLQALENTQAAEGAGRMARARAFATRFGARTATSVGRAGAKGSWDARGGLSKIGGLVGLEKEADLGLGSAGGKGGFEAMRTQAREFVGAAGTKTAAERNERVRQAQNEIAIEKGLEAVKIPAATRTVEQNKMVSAMEKVQLQMTDKEIEIFLEENRKLLDNPEFMKRITPKQIEAIDKSDKFSEEEKNRAKNSRFGDINDAVVRASTTRGATLTPEEREQIQGLTDKEIEMMPSEILGNSEFISNLKQNQVEGIEKSPKFTVSQKKSVKDQKKFMTLGLLNSPNPADNDAARNQIKKMGPKDMAKLHEDILNHPDVVSMFKKSVLKRMSGEITTEKAQLIREAIDREAHNATNRARLAGRALTPSEQQIVDTQTWLESSEGQDF